MLQVAVFAALSKDDSIELAKVRLIEPATGTNLVTVMNLPDGVLAATEKRKAD